ncbi:MAG: VCBS repeat-containing protein [Saprospirales bacterium]|nr:VCBS repeat-containing protein [Saprospirales bacterium]
MTGLASLITMIGMVDIDNDGDSDLIACEYYGQIKFFENTGTAGSPAFAAPISNPFGILVSPYSIVRNIDFSDLDQDGDLDMIYHDLLTTVDDSGAFYSENTGTAQAAVFAPGVPDPFGIDLIPGYISQPAFADIDNDGDEDLFFGIYYYYGGLVYYENQSVINSLPATANAEVTTQENIPYAFAASDFPFSDADAADMLEGIRISGLTSAGSLTFDGNPVVMNQEIPVADIGLLVFTPVANEFGDNYDSFTFQVSDGGGYSAFPATMTIDVEENVGTDETVLSVKARLSPNPAVEALDISLSFPQPPGELHFSIADQLGRVCMSWTQDAPGANFTTTAGVADLPAGLYLLGIRSGDRQSVLRFIKN